MHLVIGAGEFLGDHVTHAMAADVPVLSLNADADDESLNDALKGIEVVHLCAETWPPGHKLRYRQSVPPLFKRLLEAARRARVRRIVHVSTADVFGPDHSARVTERTRPHPVHAFERLKLFGEQWLLKAAQDLEVVILRPARVFGAGEDWILPRLLPAVVKGRLWLPGGGRSLQTFVSAADVGRACLAAADRGRPGHCYLVAGFDGTWRELIGIAARSVGVEPEISSMPYDLAYLKALGGEALAHRGAVVWPGTYAVDVLAKPHYYDDSHSRRELTWSPSVGSFEQEISNMATYIAGLADRPAAQVTSPPSSSGE
ncbi:MAG TPA: NAD-dependent epimerase/dehydratase family protein [Candidatus Micrarchaeaceae archaeon]|nr:NAD-dependent epimerase/dehydratase family protein [Candidatus Micrarchaeaceae archaeon]